jgi:hypothetical protein
LGFVLVSIYKNADLKGKDLIGGMICPKCGVEMGISGDQLRGEVSVVCPQGCGFHVWIRENWEWMPFRFVVRYE